MLESIGGYVELNAHFNFERHSGLVWLLRNALGGGQAIVVLVIKIFRFPHKISIQNDHF